MGSADGNDIVLEESLPGHLGTLSWNADRYHFKVANGAGLTHEGQALSSTIELLPDTTDHPTILRRGSFSFYLIERGPEFFVRTKDNDSPTRRAFHGIDRFPVDPAWRIEARWEPYDPPRSLGIPNVLGQIAKEPLFGAIVFVHEGQTVRLHASGDPSEGMSLIFGDTTNGLSTYGGGRFLDLDPPRDDGTIIVDFNRAYDPPCVFTPFATCPLPPQENVLPFELRAGEKMWGEPHSH